MSYKSLPVIFTVSAAALTACGADTEGTPTAQVDALCVETLGTADAPVCVLEGEYTEDHTLTADRAYLLRGGVFIGDDEDETVLTIEPGVTVYGETSEVAFLTIRRGSKIMAEGTADAPIVFTSAADTRSRGDWGGIILNGRSTLNICDGTSVDVCTAEGEGGTGTYGGDDEADSSGVLSYVRVEFAGKQLSAENELNGIAFQAVGSGTVVDHVQAHMGADDGVEFFGGTVNAKHVYLTGNGDDSLDWTYGWRGKVQFVAIQQYTSGGDNGFEADNYDKLNTALPTAQPTISNVTVVGSPNNSDSDIGMLLRAGTGGHISNAIVTGFNEACLDVTDEATFDEATAGVLTLQNSILSCATDFKKDETDPLDVEDWFLGQTGNSVEDPKLADAFNLATPDLRPTGTSPALDRGVAPAGSFFDAVDYIGGIDPDDDWTQGWTTADTQ